MSWWYHEQGLDARAMTMSERLETLDRYWESRRRGWWPSIPRDQWVGPHHPWHPHGEWNHRDGS